jgi:hypothetical protein
MFANQKPVEFTVKPLPTPLQNNTLPLASPFEAQAMIKIPPPSSSPALPPPTAVSVPEKKEEIVYFSKSETTIPQSETNEPCSITIPQT